MSTSVTYVDPIQPENKMRLYRTKVINIIGGPSCDKSLFSSSIVLKLHLMGKTVEMVPEIAKIRVWQRDFASLRNQYALALEQFQMLEVLNGQVQYLVTEGSLPQLLYYNQTYADNICDVSKTHAQILAWYRQFENNNIFVQRNLDKKYIRSGRLQDETQAREIDSQMRTLLANDGIRYKLLAPDHRAIIEYAATLE